MGLEFDKKRLLEEMFKTEKSLSYNFTPNHFSTNTSTANEENRSPSLMFSIGFPDLISVDRHFVIL